MEGCDMSNAKAIVIDSINQISDDLDGIQSYS